MPTDSTYWNPMVPELNVTDFSASLYFYVDILGFTKRLQRKNPDFAYLLCLGKAHIMLEQHHSHSWDTAELIKPLGRGINFQIEVDDIEAISSYLDRYDIAL